jgi:formiminotetrahydrofolate cyclodeaminase
MLNKTCLDFEALLASASPVPGGGSACAYIGALGMALGSMVGNLTTGKKKYMDVEEDIQLLNRNTLIVMKRFNALVEADIQAFSALSAAYALPAATDLEKQNKDQIMQPLLSAAASVPLEIAECAVEALMLLKDYALKGSRMVVSDAGTGAAFCKAAIEGARLNVLVNLKLMKDTPARQEMSSRLQMTVTKGTDLADEVYACVLEELI